MKEMIFCKPTGKGIHSFYLETSDRIYFLFSQDYRKGVQNYYSSGVRIDESFNYGKSHVDMFKPFTVFLCTDGVSNTIQAGKELEMITEIEKGINVRNLKEELTDFMKDISNYSFDDITLGVVKHE